jgi:hypothetical protein
MLSSHWIAQTATIWDTFVANRVAKIQHAISVSNWHHVRSAENPADVITRGVTVENLIRSQQWWHGPEWLKKPQFDMDYPTLFEAIQQEDIPEKLKCLVLTDPQH